MLSRVLSAVVLLLALAPGVRAQVRVTVPPKNYLIGEQITATVTNDKADAITVCVESGQISTTKDSQVSTPVPFTIEIETHQGWKVSMVSPDSGGSRVAVVLESNKSLEFPFWPPSRGKLRLRMRYWDGARPGMNCAHPPKDSRKAKTAFVEVPIFLT
jgi:hypothetical protein